MDRYWLAISLPVVLICLTTIGLYIEAKNEESQQIEQAFIHDANEHLNSLEQIFASYFNTLFAIKSLFDSSELVNREEFNTFVSHSLATQPGILALEWVPRVHEDERIAYKQLAHEEGFPDFRFKRWQDDRWTESEEPWADVYYPVYYIEPYEGNEIAMGIDLGSNEARRQALQEARDSNELIASSPIILLNNEGRRETGVLLILPVFKPHDAVTTLEERRSHNVGFILAVFRFEDIIQTSLENFENINLLLKVTDETAASDNHVFFDQTREQETVERLQYIEEYTVGGKRWRALVVATADYAAAKQTGKPAIILAGGMILASLIGTLVWALGTRMHMVDQIIAKSSELEIVNSELLDVSAKLATSKRRLERNNQELRQFAYVASHDLQEPLRAVSSYIQLLSRRYRGELDEEADEFIDFAVDGTARMKRLINDLLLYSRLDKSEREFCAVDLNDIVSHVCYALSINIEETGTKLEYGRLPIVMGIESQLTQLFQNLISNAIKFRKEYEAPTINIDAKQTGDGWLVSISDNGIGLDAQFSDRIFKIFQRLHNQEEYSGTGIGLAICKKVVEQHGGLIWVHSVLGEGSTFSFTLPNAEGNYNVKPNYQQTDRNLVG